MIFRATDVGYDDLLEDADRNGYFNLDLLKQKAAVQKQDKLGKTTYEIMPQFTVYELWGKEYAIEKEKDGETEAELYRQIGQLKVELDWLKKKSQKLLS